MAEVLLIETGCAECSWSADEPLLEARVFPDAESAKRYVGEQGWLMYATWAPHPQGGEFANVSQGAVWLIPLADVAAVGVPSDG